MAGGTNAPKASGILINTFSKIEALFLDALQSRQVMEKLPLVYPIELIFLTSMSMNHSNDQDNDDVTAKQFLQWLDMQLTRSIVYMRFGSRSTMSDSHIIELATGLEGSGQLFI